MPGDVRPIPYELRIGVIGPPTLHSAAGVERSVEHTLSHIRQTLASASQHPRGPCGPRQTIWQRTLRVLGKGLKLVWREMPLTADTVPAELLTPVEWTIICDVENAAGDLVAAALKRNSDRVELKKLCTDGDRPAARPERPGTEEDGQLIARKIVDECEILIAIWTDKQSPEDIRHETAIRYALDLGRLVVWVEPEAGDVAPKILSFSKTASHHDSERPRAQVTSTEVAPGILSSPLPRCGKSLSVGFHQLSSYNRDAAWNREQDEQLRHRTMQRWLRGAAEARLPDRWLRNIADCLVPHYTRADQLAIRYQQLYVFAATWLFYLSATAVTVAVTQNLLFPQVSSLIILEVGCMVAILVLLGLSQQGAYHAKWLNDRLLAEHIRVAFFCTIAGVRDTASEARQVSHLPFYRKADDWVFHVVDRLIESCPASSAVESGQVHHLPALKRFLLDTWIVDQANWHARNSQRKYHASHRAHRLGAGLFTATLILALLHLFGVGHQHAGPEHDHQAIGWSWLPVGVLIASLAIVLPAWGAAVHAIETLLERERIAERSDQMAAILQEISRRIERTTDLPSLQGEVRRARDVILAENHEWFVSLRFRPPVLPA